jgi:uncharacterized protein YecA (UPF0149 family)
MVPPPPSAFDTSIMQRPDGAFAKIFTGDSDADVYRKMDATKVRVEANGGTEVSRSKIGVNSPCPCGSKRKYKKCCMRAG